MKKILRISLVILLFILVVAHFFLPEKNQGEITQNHLFEQIAVPDGVQTILKNACLDCHSEQTNYLWYHHIAPVSWMIHKHISDGKEDLNLSHWGQLDMMGKLTTLDKMKEEVEKGTMPLKPYTLMHPKAKLTDEQKEQFYAWIDNQSEELLLKMMSE